MAGLARLSVLRRRAALLCLAAALPLPAAAPLAAQDRHCTCIGLGKVVLHDRGEDLVSGNRGGGDMPLRYRLPQAPELPAIDATITIACRPAGSEAMSCRAEVQAVIGAGRVGDASGHATAPAPACLLAGQAIAAAWKAAVGDARPDSAPAPCS